MPDDHEQSYLVGYKKPPKHSQYRRGRSGNPKGRPKCPPRSFLESLDDELQKMIHLSENGERMEVTKGEAVVKRLINSAISGNERSIAAVIKLVPLFEKLFEKRQWAAAARIAQERQKLME